MAAREFLRLTQEVTWGVYQTSPPTNNVAIINLHQANPFTMRPRPIMVDERTAGGSNRKIYRQSAQTTVSGKLVTRLYPSQAKILMPWALGIASSGGAPFDLPSVTIDHCLWLDDSSAKVYRRYLGCKVDALDLTASNSGDAIKATCSFDITAKQPATITVTDFAEPVYGTAPTYPGDLPYLFEELRGNLTVGSSRSAFRSINLSVKNRLRKPFDENQYIGALRWSGRDVNLGLDFRYLAATDRTNLEAVTPLTVSFAFGDGTNTATFDMKTNSYLDAVDDELMWEDPGFYQKLMLSGLLDTTQSTPTDLTFAQTP